jgi:hypothetical protein
MLLAASLFAGCNRGSGSGSPAGASGAPGKGGGSVGIVAAGERITINNISLEPPTGWTKIVVPNGLFLAPPGKSGDARDVADTAGVMIIVGAMPDGSSEDAAWDRIESGRGYGGPGAEKKDIQVDGHRVILITKSEPPDNKTSVVAQTVAGRNTVLINCSADASHAEQFLPEFDRMIQSMRFTK